MLLRTVVCRVTIANRFTFTTGDGVLISADCSDAEQERASSCNVVLYDPNLRLLNLFLTQFQYDGGIAVPTELFDKKDQSTATTGSIVIAGVTIGGDASAYLSQIQAKYGTSDLSGLTEAGKKAYGALSSANVIGYLCAIAIAELGDPYGEPLRGYGKLFGDTGDKETFDPKTLTDHPNQSRSSGRLVSTATGRYQFLNTTWSGLKSKLGLKDFKPVAQEIGAVSLLNDAGVLDNILAGNFDGAIPATSRIWASLEGNPYGQGSPTGKKTVFLANVQKYKTLYTQATTSANNPTIAKTDSTTTTSTSAATPATTTTTTAPTATSSTTTPAIDVSQGIKIRIELAFNDDLIPRAYDYIFTDVKGSNDAPNTISIAGKQVRAIISKSSNKIYKVHRNTTIRQLTIAIASKTGASAEIEDSDQTNKVYTTIQQKENDYQMLLKLAQKAGLFIRGDDKSIKIESLSAKAQKFVISRKALLRGCSWGDSASSDRVLRGQTATSGSSSSGSASTGGAISIGSGRGIVSFGGVFTPAVCAFANLIAWKEVPDSMNPRSYYSNNFTGYFDDADIVAGGGFPKTAGTTRNVGRYQFNRTDWIAASLKNYLPPDQDQLYYWKMNYRQALQPLLAGDIATAIERAGKEWASLPGSPYGQVQAGYTVAQAIAYYNEQLKLFSGTASPSTTTTTTSATGTSATAIINSLPGATQTISGGLQPISTAADESQGIGKGFEGTLLVNPLVMPKILDAVPGAIVSLDKDTGYGDALTREYRVSEIKRSYSKQGLLITLSVYLPVAVTPKNQQSSAVASGSTGVASTGGDGDAAKWSADLLKSPQAGDTVAGITITSPYGKRVSPGGVGSTDHQGCDAGCQSGTPVYLIALPGESITATYIPNNGGAGNEVTYKRGKWRFRNLHLHGGKTAPLFGGATTKTFTAGQIIAYTNNTGSSTGDHLHFEQRDQTGGADTPVPPQKGYLQWALTGKAP